MIFTRKGNDGLSDKKHLIFGKNSAITFVYRLTFFDVGDTEDFHTKIRDQLQMDYSEAQQEYNTATLEESSAKADLRRRKFLKDNPKEVKSRADKNLVARDTSHYQTEFEAKRKLRRDAKKELDEAYKAFDTHRDEEAKGFVKENDITKVGSQYKANWTHLPGYV